MINRQVALCTFKKWMTTKMLSIHTYSSGIPVPLIKKVIFLMKNEMNSMVYILYAFIF